MWQCCTCILPRLAEIQTQFPLLPFPLLLPLPSIPISAELEDLLTKLLEKSPEHRITIPEIRVSQSVISSFCCVQVVRMLLRKKSLSGTDMFIHVFIVYDRTISLSFTQHTHAHTHKHTHTLTYTHIRVYARRSIPG